MKTILSIVLLLLSCIAHAQHSVVLKSGERISCIVLEMVDDQLLVSVNRTPKKIHMRDVSSIFFDEYIPYNGELKEDTPVKRIKSADGGYTLEYVIKDRDMIKAPKISNATEKRGTVVVEITVNRAGTVLKTKAGVTGSTTSDEYLLTKAQFACMDAKFNTYMKGPLETVGTITINY